MVEYEKEFFIGFVLSVHQLAIECPSHPGCQHRNARVACLPKPFGVNIPQKRERDEDAIFYCEEMLFKSPVRPKLEKIGRAFMYKY